MKFFHSTYDPKFKGYSGFILLKTPNYSPSGYTIGYFDEGFYTEDSSEDITVYVTEWAYLN